MWWNDSSKIILCYLGKIYIFEKYNVFLTVRTNKTTDSGRYETYEFNMHIFIQNG